MWVFSRILGTTLALACRALYAIWVEATQSPLALPPGNPRPDAP